MLAEDPGEWTELVKCGDRPALPEFEPSEAMSAFVNYFLADHWLELQDYAEVLEEADIDLVNTRTADFDMGVLDARVVLALIMKAIRADRFCEGELEWGGQDGLPG